MVPTSARTRHPARHSATRPSGVLRRHTSYLRRGDARVRWVRISTLTVPAPGLGAVAEHDPLLALARIAPAATVFAAMAAQAVRIRVARGAEPYANV